MIIDELYIGDDVEVETGFTNWDRSDNEFYCTVAGCSENGMVILDAKNAVSFDGRNKIQPYFVVDKRTEIEEWGGSRKIPGCYVLWDIVGMDDCGRFILRTERGKKSGRSHRSHSTYGRGMDSHEYKRGIYTCQGQ